MDNDNKKQLMKNSSDSKGEIPESISKIVASNLNENFSSLISTQKFMCNFQSPIIPTTLAQSIANMQKALYLPAFEQMYEPWASISKMYIDMNINSEIFQLSNMLHNSELVKSIRMINENFNHPALHIFQSPALQWFRSFIPPAVSEPLRQNSNVDFNKFIEIYLKEMYNAHWFPNIYLNMNDTFIFELLNILERTRKSKNRVKKIDKAIYNYFTQNEIEERKKRWRTHGLPEHQMRILHQAVQAYHRKEYAVTVIVLSTQWEGIIYNKVHDCGRKKSKRTKQHLSNLVNCYNYSEIFNSYFQDYIMYDCNSTKDVIEDVPGRHSAAHSFYEKYPPRKAALNAILFTDFLIQLEALEEEEKNGEDENGISQHDG